jgi:hypothetical protein
MQPFYIGCIVQKKKLGKSFPKIAKGIVEYAEK